MAQFRNVATMGEFQQFHATNVFDCSRALKNGTNTMPLSHISTMKTGLAKTLCDGFLKRFIRAEDGALVVFGIYVFLIILMTAGIGIDLMHYERNRTRLQYTLDRAVLAAADLEQTQDPTEVVRDYFSKAGLLSYLTAVNVTGDAFHRQVSADVSAGFATQFMRLTGVENLAANVKSTALERVPNVEISLVLDISGSMGTNDRVTLMKSAAKSFTTTVLARNTNSDTGETNPNQTSLNVVPFSGQTNPGESIFEYLGGERFGTTGDHNYFPEWSQDISNVVFRFDLSGDGEIDYSVKIEGYPDNDVAMFNKDDLDSYYEYAIDYIQRVNPLITAGSESMVGATIKGGQEPTSYFSVLEGGMGDPASDDGPTKFNDVDMEISFNDFYNGIVPNNTSSCLEMTYNDFLDTGLPSGSTEQVAYFVNWDFDEVTQDWGWCPEDSMAVQYAQKDEAALHDFIDNLRLHDGTGTNYNAQAEEAARIPVTGMQAVARFLGEELAKQRARGVAAA